MKITKIEMQAKRKDRYSVFVDDKFAFGISELGLIESGLKIGQEFNKDELEGLKTDAKKDRVYNQALALIVRRPRSQWELQDYLRRKGIEESVATEIMSKLADKGFVDDKDFARRWVENRRLLKPLSRRKLELELRQKRVPDSDIKQALVDDETEEYDVLLQEVEKKRKQSRYQDDLKLMQYLSRQGYNYDDIKRALAADEISQ